MSATNPKQRGLIQVGRLFVQVLRLGGLTGREDHIPVALHVDDSPASRICFIECLVETAHIGFAIISPFAVRIGTLLAFAENDATDELPPVLGQLP